MGFDSSGLSFQQFKKISCHPKNECDHADGERKAVWPNA